MGFGPATKYMVWQNNRPAQSYYEINCLSAWSSILFRIRRVDVFFPAAALAVCRVSFHSPKSTAHAGNLPWRCCHRRLFLVCSKLAFSCTPRAVARAPRNNLVAQAMDENFQRVLFANIISCSDSCICASVNCLTFFANPRNHQATLLFTNIVL